MITVSGLTLTYPSGKGVFDLNFTVPKGVVMGYLGPNGAGKTTTFRALLGFMRPNSGRCSIDGLDCVEQAPQIQNTLGYIPGEISFPEGMSGDGFLALMSAMRGDKSDERKNQLLEMLELDPRGKIKKFSKGMKQKLGIVAAFMHNPDVLVLDEPTSGLDPLMQNRFNELIIREKANGKTIFMSSHIFEEVEKVCDMVLIIKEGKIVEQSDIQKLKDKQRRVFIVRPGEPDIAVSMLKAAGFDIRVEQDGMLEVSVSGEKVDAFVKTAAQFTVLNLSVKYQSLEDIFIHYFGKRE